VNDEGECKKCGARITRSTTFCRSCDTVFPEFVEITEEEPKKTKTPKYQGLTYSSPDYSKQEEKAEPKERSRGTELEEPTPKPEPEPKEAKTLEPPTEPEVPKALNTEPVPSLDAQSTPDPKVDESARKEPSKKDEKKDPPKEELTGKKSDSGELAVFKNPEFIQTGYGLRLIESGKKFFSSAEIITELASETSRLPDEVAGVVDGFWDYLADIRNHYSPNNKRQWSLTIPHFGTFRFHFDWKKERFQPKLTFKSSTTASAKAHRRTYSSKWADQWSGDLGILSIRRKISVYISERSGLSLRLSDMILNRILRTTRELCEGGGRIHWARRGTMGTFRVVDKKELSRTNLETGENITLHKGRNSITGERVPAEGNEHFSFSASEGFLKRLTAPEPPNESRSKKYATPKRTSKDGKSTGCSGCLGLCILVVVGVVVLFVGRRQVYKTEKPNVINTPAGYDRIESETLKVFTSTRRNTPAPKSVRTGIKTGIKFSNQLDFPVIGHWIHFDGSRKKLFPLQPQEEMKLDTYAGHVWLITDMEDRALMFFIATKLKNRTHGLASITSENLPTQ
jgi:nucleoid DNA-binding protein